MCISVFNELNASTSLKSLMKVCEMCTNSVMQISWTVDRKYTEIMCLQYKLDCGNNVNWKSNFQFPVFASSQVYKQLEQLRLS